MSAVLNCTLVGQRLRRLHPRALPRRPLRVQLCSRLSGFGIEPLRHCQDPETGIQDVSAGLKKGLVGFMASHLPESSMII